MKTLILGMGNTLLSDDSIGILIKRYLERKLKVSEYIDFVETSWGGFRIIDLLRGYDYAIIIDSIRTAYKAQGYIHHLRPTDFLPTLRLTSYHDINFATAIKLAETLDVAIPKEIDILAVEIENNYTISEHLSPALWNSINKCSEKIIKFLILKKVLPECFSSICFHKPSSAEEINELYSEDHQKNEINTSLKFIINQT